MRREIAPCRFSLCVRFRARCDRAEHGSVGPKAHSQIIKCQFCQALLQQMKLDALQPDVACYTALMD